MDVIASPLITAVLNLIASVLVAKGILDSKSAADFVQFGNSAFASLMTFGVAVYSIYKVVELKKHQLNISTQAPTATTTEKIITISQPISQTPLQEPAGQKGVGNGNTSVPNPTAPLS